MKATIVLSDGEEAEVLVLGLYDLDKVKQPNLDRFTYEVVFPISGEKRQAEFRIDRFKEPPQMPDMPEEEIQPGTPEFGQLRIYRTYQAALLHEKRRFDDAHQYREDVAHFILNHCISAEVRSRIVTEEDWHKVKRAALVPPITFALIAETLQVTYSAKWNHGEIIQALWDETQGGLGEYDSIRVWEGQLMIKMRWSELEYATIELGERVRKLCVYKIDDWISTLESNRQRKIMEAKAARSG